MKQQIKQLRPKISEVRQIKKGVFLFGFTSAHLGRTARPGNFLHIKTEATILRRPLSIHKIKGNKIYILFKLRGRGTKALSRKKRGDTLDVTGPLGKGFRIKKKNTILIAGGIGIAPLLFLAEKIKEKELKSRKRKENIILLGAKDKKELVCAKDFKNLGFRVAVSTEDGSTGHKGFVTGLLEKMLAAESFLLPAQIYACGPKEMFYRISRILKYRPKIEAQVSFEQFMGCGLGVCCACVIDTKYGYKKVCQDGPVFDLKDIW